MAQLVERLVRNEEASGSNPLISTKKQGRRQPSLFFVSIIVRTAEFTAVRARSERGSLFLMRERIERRRLAPYAQTPLISTKTKHAFGACFVLDCRL